MYKKTTWMKVMFQSSSPCFKLFQRADSYIIFLIYHHYFHKSDFYIIHHLHHYYLIRWDFHSSSLYFFWLSCFDLPQNSFLPSFLLFAKISEALNFWSTLILTRLLVALIWGSFDREESSNGDKNTSYSVRYWQRCSWWLINWRSYDK